jgi:predicted regulator of Ras-like GTPase activity (Roadblock/LC7/MglB family)
VVGKNARELAAWESRTLIGCLHDLLQNKEVICALVVREDAAVLAKVVADAKFDVDALGTFSSMIFATSRMLLQTLGTEGEILGHMELGAGNHLLIMGITSTVALVTFSRTLLARGLMEHQARAMVPRIVNCLNPTNRPES